MQIDPSQAAVSSTESADTAARIQSDNRSALIEAEARNQEMDELERNSQLAKEQRELENRARDIGKNISRVA